MPCGIFNFIVVSEHSGLYRSDDINMTNYLFALWVLDRGSITIPDILTVLISYFGQIIIDKNRV